ncbi:hypothetical protein TNCV_4556031 [Trichonephila clavipes]|nr:hypothetical protein TNCV_4556031 [Trichonephila clavipes]
MPSTFSEVFSDSKQGKGISVKFLLKRLGPQKRPGGVLHFEGHTEANRFAYLDFAMSLKSLTFEQKLKVFKICTKRNAA